MLLRICEFLSQIHKELLKDYHAINRAYAKNKRFTWNPNAEKAFENPKQAFTTAPILFYANLEKPFIIEADASHFALGCILSQNAHDEKLHPVAFHSHKFKAAETNYEIHEKELLAVVESF